ncbi:hypothetical protein [Hydrogenophaga sp.]|uniref:hypothetical protein n=1 Tax=Hydrogenophaga sp. TaxID=1904254 RepID=UPI0027179084|nr:hypothetical protein [Hydrogenophaga sp.]MDO8903409.1 hypothetical protein [Hydrogenophaga sp.]
MRSAPSVVYPVGRCVLYGRYLFALSALVLTVLIGWALSSSGRYFVDAIWAGVASWALWSIWVFKSWWYTPKGALHWDSLAPSAGDSPRAGAWRWLADEGGENVSLQAIECVIDWQSWMLLRLKQPSHLATWVWVERHCGPARWGDLRRALMATRRV